MLIVTLVGLYTSRVILKALGADDFGLYSVVGGIVALFAFFRSSMEKCTQRFLNFEMGKDGENLYGVFGNALTIHIGIATIAFILAETIGIWFLNTHINIPEGREYAANCIYQTVVGGLLLTIFSIPYSAAIIAHERMGIFAIISIVECACVLITALIINLVSQDRLILYGILVLATRLTVFIICVAYCYVNISETKVRPTYDKSISRKMLGYTSWALLGHAMILGTNQGNIILVNMFHGVSANAAMAVANQVNSHVLSLTSNFQTAFNPQITKSYAVKDFTYLQSLMISTSKLSYFLLFAICLPLFLNIDFILDIWLEDVPIDTNIFCILMLSSGIIQATTSPLNFSIMATGRIKWFQIVTGLVFISDLFILYFFFNLGLSAPTAMWVKLSIMIIVAIVRAIFVHKVMPEVIIKDYFNKALIPILATTLIAVPFALFLISFANSIVGKLSLTLIVFIITLGLIVFVGFTNKERQVLLNFFKHKKNETKNDFSTR